MDTVQIGKEIELMASQFGLGGLSGIEEITVGKTNRTYRADFDQGSFIFQRINTYVFHNPKDVMDNVELVTSHINAKAPQIPCRQYIKTLDGRGYTTLDNSVWRVCPFVESVTYNSTKNPNLVRNEGRAFGSFQSNTADLDPALLHCTIEDFHNTVKKYATLKKVYENDVLDLAYCCRNEVDFVLSMHEKAFAIERLKEAGRLPLRVTHNDTKLNNVLFESGTDRAICVIDLDTVMPGLVAHDFGDAIRSAGNSMGSASLEFGLVRLDLDIFRAFAEGYLEYTADMLTRDEVLSLAQSPLVMTLELASRYLADYLQGNLRFMTKYPTQNLDRARNLIALAQDMNRRLGDMHQIIMEITGC